MSELVESLLGQLDAIATSERLTRQRRSDPAGGDFPSDLDDAVTALMTALRSAPVAIRQNVGSRLNDRLSAALYRFALRAATNAVGSHDRSLIRTGLDALVIQVAHPDPRDIWQPVAALYRSAEILGGDISALFSDAADLAHSETSDFVATFPRREPKDRRLDAFKLEEQGEGKTFRYVSRIPTIDDPEAEVIRRLIEKQNDS